MSTSPSGKKKLQTSKFLFENLPTSVQDKIYSSQNAPMMVSAFYNQLYSLLNAGKKYRTVEKKYPPRHPNIQTYYKQYTIDLESLSKAHDLTTFVNWGETTFHIHFMRDRFHSVPNQKGYYIQISYEEESYYTTMLNVVQENKKIKSIHFLMDETLALKSYYSKYLLSPNTPEHKKIIHKAIVLGLFACFCYMDYSPDRFNEKDPILFGLPNSNKSRDIYSYMLYMLNEFKETPLDLKEGEPAPEALQQTSPAASGGRRKRV
jgi:hypothetical protein